MPETASRTKTQYFDEVMTATTSDILPSTRTYNMLKAYVRTASIDGKGPIDSLSPIDASTDTASNFENDDSGDRPWSAPCTDSTHSYYGQTQYSNDANNDDVEFGEDIYDEEISYNRS